MGCAQLPVYVDNRGFAIEGCAQLPGYLDIRGSLQCAVLNVQYILIL